MIPHSFVLSFRIAPHFLKNFKMTWQKELMSWQKTFRKISNITTDTTAPSQYKDGLSRYVDFFILEIRLS